MKKILFLVLLFASVLFCLAAENPDDVTNQVGLELKDYDKVVFEVYPYDISSSEDTKPISEISISRGSGSTWYVSVIFRIQVTSTHTIYLTLSTDGPLSLEGSNDETQKIDYSLHYTGTYWESDETKSWAVAKPDINFDFDLDQDAKYVFGRSAFSTGKYDYTAKKFYHIGNNGYLNINDATMSYFSVRIEKENTVGKQFGTYSSNIYLTATTAD